MVQSCCNLAVVAGASFLFAVGCGGAAQNVESVKSTPAEKTDAPRAATTSKSKGQGKTIEDAVQLCLSDEDEPRTDYPYIAEYQCSDGSIPLEGKLLSAARSRVGNVGAGPDGHIIDLYEIPCPTGKVRVFVDGYHCKSEGMTKVDPEHLTRQQLLLLARGVRIRHDDPSSREGMKLRKYFVTWLTATPQVSIVLCDVRGLLSGPDKPEYLAEYIISLGAAVIEDGHDPVDPINTHLAAFAGVAKYYQAVLREEGQSARDANLDKLVQMLQNGELKKKLPKLLKGCKLDGMGVRY